MVLQAVFLLVSLLAALGALITTDDTWLIGEDHGLEWAAAVMFLASALLALWRLRPALRPTPWHAWVILPLGLAAALSEISFGARMFEWQMPQMAGGGEFDGVHDTFLVALRAWQRWYLGAPWAARLVGLVVLLAALAAGLALAWRWRGLLEVALVDTSGRRLLAALGLLVLAQLLDLGLVPLRQARHVEEWAEAAAAYWMLAASAASLAAARARIVATAVGAAAACARHPALPEPPVA
jgi:hypothetical protein